MEAASPQRPSLSVALEALPSLHAAVQPGLRRQTARASLCLARFQERSRLRAAIGTALRDPRGGLVAVEGAQGSGVTSLLCAVAAAGAYPLWLPAEGAGDIATLYAQLVARYRPAMPLLDPTVLTDPAALESLLSEAVAARTDATPVVLVIDDYEPPGERLRPGPTPFPSELPPGVALLLGTTPGAYLPYTPRTRIRLQDDPELRQTQRQALVAMGCEPWWAKPIIAASGGNFLYLALALALIREGSASPMALPTGLDRLLRSWWATLGAAEQRVAALFAAAGEPLPLPLLDELCEGQLDPILARWQRLGLIDLAHWTPPTQDDETSTSLGVAAFRHRAIAALLLQIVPALLAQAHDDLARRGLAQRDQPASAGGEYAPSNDDGLRARYLDRQVARHLALGAVEGRAALPMLLDRERLLRHDRRGTLAQALDEARWELRVAATEGSELRLARATALAGLLATRARSLALEAVAEALEVGMGLGGREAALKRVLEIVERLPDGYGKALLLRRLGEICYNQRMRSSAMRLLSRALDLEAAPTSRAWRDSREALMAALAETALDAGAIDQAIAIAERIEHLERRGQIETGVVRALLAAGDWERAQRLARAILHESMGAWARAEVGVTLVRGGDPRGAMLLEELTLETVAAWAQIELACDEAVYDETAARRRIDALPTQGQRDRALARVARVLAAADNDGAALAAAESIVGVEARVATLIELRLSLEGLVAMLALERATSDIAGVSGDDRAPLVAALGAALAAIGRRERAIDLAQTLPAGEERDRALARIAVGLGQRGEYDEARELLATLVDEDECGWAFEELAKLLAAEGRWDEATSLAGRITVGEQRAKALAELAIARARGDQLSLALAMAMDLEAPSERARALTMMAPALVARGVAEALAVIERPGALSGAEARSRYLVAVVSALTERGELEAAMALMLRVRRPADRARAGAVLARALATERPDVARPVLGAALRSAAVGREEALRALELAAPAFAALGGTALLGAIAAAVDEIDRWL